MVSFALMLCKGCVSSRPCHAAHAAWSLPTVHKRSSIHNVVRHSNTTLCEWCCSVLGFGETTGGC